MDLLSAHRSLRTRAVAIAALLCAAALLGALLPAAAMAGSSSSRIPATALIDDLKATDTAGIAGLLQPVVAPPAILGAAATLPTATEPVAYAAGTVAVSIIFPQSSGASGTKHTESWTATDTYGPPGLTSAAYSYLTPRQVYIVAEIQKTLDWWMSKAPAAAQLQFVIPAAGKLGAPQEVKVAREPIDIASTNDQLWRHPIMAKLKYPATSAADTPPPETAYDNAVRKANGTDWAFTIYVVDSLHDDAAATHDKTPGEFPNGAFAYTFALFGPYSVLTYDNATFTPANFDGVLAHEIGHIFGALDEYAAPAGYPSSGSLYSGYLWVRNSNATQGGTTNDACIMRGGLEGLDAYKGIPYGSDLNDGGICPSTAGQIGWRVTRNGLPDVVDTTPTITVNPPVSTGNPSTLTVAGSAREVAWPPGHNAKGRAFAKGISIFVPHDFQYSVDGGSPVTINPAGSGATRTFSVTVDTSALGAGPDAGAPTRHVIAVQATTGTPATKNVVAWAAPTPVTLTLKSAAATIALGGKASLTVHAADTNDALQTTYPIGHLAGVSVGPRGGVAASRKTVTTGAAGNAAATFTPSFTTTYAATFTPGPSSREFTAATPALVTVAVRARLTASAAAPTAARVVRVAGTLRPRRAGVALALQALRGGVWTTVARKRTTAGATFRLVYTAPAGTLRLRVRFAGDARNAATVEALPAVAVP